MLSESWYPCSNLWILERQSTKSHQRGEAESAWSCTKLPRLKIANSPKTAIGPEGYACLRVLVGGVSFSARNPCTAGHPCNPRGCVWGRHKSCIWEENRPRKTQLELFRLATGAHALW